MGLGCCLADRLFVFLFVLFGLLDWFCFCFGLLMMVWVGVFVVCVVLVVL